MTDRTSDDPPGLASRRTVLRGAALAGVAVPFLAACSDASSDNSTTEGGSRSASGGPVRRTALRQTAEAPARRLRQRRMSPRAAA